MTGNIFAKRRGISSIIGGMIFLLLMSSGISVYFLAIESQAEMIEAQRKVADTKFEKILEEFSIAATTNPDDSNRLAIQVMNDSPNSLEIADIWIINKTDAPNGFPAARHEISYLDTIIPSGYGRDILENTPIYMVAGEYDIKVISTLGTIKKKSIDADGNDDLKVELIAIPPDVEIGQNVTLAMRVTNVGEYDITDIMPFGPPEANPLSAVVSSALVSDPQIERLQRGESQFFRWQFTVTGPEDTPVTFTNNATGKILDGEFNVTSNNDSELIMLRADPNDVVGGDEIVIRNELFAKPQIFMMMPNPMGENFGDRSVWGVMVSNPTDQPMYVNKVVIMAISSRASSSDKVFIDKCEEASAPESPVTVSPTPDRWSCPESNQLMWKDVSNPQIVEPRSVFPFMVRIAPGSLGSSLPDASYNILIQPIVFTTLGQFGKAGYGSTMHDKETAMPNVYLSKIPQTSNPANIMGEIRGILEGSSVLFNATITDMDDDEDWEIKDDTKLIINIPPDWTLNNIVSNVGFDGITNQTFPDGSTQIVGSLINDLEEPDDAKTIQFNATAPLVPAAKMYVMHILADGTASGEEAGDFTVGPLAETVLQVCPTGGCP